MAARSLVLICAAAMLTSLFLPWLAGPFGSETVPWNTLKTLDRTQVEQMISDLPPEGMAFLGSFALAAILVLLGLMGSAPRFLAIITGGIPVGLVAWALFRATQNGGDSPLPVSGGDLTQVLDQLVDFIGPGAWAWMGGGALLLLLGLFAPNRR